MAHNAFWGQGVYAIARCCTWPKAECRINASSQAAEGAGCSPQDHVLTGKAQKHGSQTLGAAGMGLSGDIPFDVPSAIYRLQLPLPLCHSG